MNLPTHYDDADPTSIIRYANDLIDTTLRRSCPPHLIYGQYKGKGSFGQFLEKCYFGITPNNRPEPDFLSAGIELKSFPLRISSKGKICAKERMVLSIINYQTIIDEEFENSHFWAKSKRILIIFYLFAREMHSLDQRIKDVADLNMETTEFSEDLRIIRSDWSLIKRKVEQGFAHEISESDTLYLGACTKGSTAAGSIRKQPYSNHGAKQRAFSLKQRYMSSFVEKNGIAQPRHPRKEVSILSTAEAGDEFDVRAHVEGAFRGYFGYSIDDLQNSLGTNYNKLSKGFYAQLTKHILGLKLDAQISEFVKAGITVKTIRLEKKGNLKESVSFPYFKYCNIIDQAWETSDLREIFLNPFLFIVFRKTESRIILSNAFFWSMPEADLGLIEKTWLETKKRIKEGAAESLPRSSETMVVHVRPHARDRSDTIPLPYGGELVKKSFWLNRGYIAQNILAL